MAWAFEPIAIPSDIVETRFYAPVPFMVWAAIRFRMYGATAAVAVLTVFVVRAAIDGTGSFAALSPAEVSSRLQHFLLLRAAPLYLVAVLIKQWVTVTDSLRESERRFRNIADQSPMMIWMAAPDGRCEFVNRRWLEFTGLSLEEFLGDGWNRIVHPDDFGRSNNDYLRSIEARESFENEARLRRHDGEFRWILSRGTPRFSPTGVFIGYLAPRST
jgi:PAS domain S-box-containing protein